MAGPFSRLFGRHRPKYLLAIDAGSSSAVRSFLFEVSPAGRFGIERRVSALPDRDGEAELIPHIIGELRRLLTRSVRRLGCVPTGALVGLGNHFTFNESRVCRSVRERPERAIGEHELGSILSSFLTFEGERVIGAKRYLLASVSPLGVAVDGYTVDALSRATKGREIEISLMATYALDAFWESFLELRTLWRGLSLTSISNQTAIAGALISRLSVPEALVVKIGARITEVTLVGGGTIRSSAQFPLGGDAVTQAIAEEMGIARGDAERIKRQLGRMTLPARAAARADAAVRDAVRAWLQAFRETIASGPHALPERTYLIGGGARLQAIGDALSSQPWYAEITGAPRVDVRILDAADITGPLFRNHGPALAGPDEVALAALTVRLIQ
ncbi:MAG: hypothetical protein Q8R35_01355 [bacterium]|nr:hypothetical protein [bacterium]